MKKYLLPENGNYYKANLHCHSTISDGKWTVEEIKKNYMAEGYSVIAYTDHSVFLTHNDLTDDNFLALNGYEINADQPMDPNMDKTLKGRILKTCHLCLIATDKDRKTQKIAYEKKIIEKNIDKVCLDESCEIKPIEYTPESISATIRSARDDGFYVTYNHPVWSLETKDEYCNYHGMNAMEMVNYSSICVGLDERNSQQYDEMLRGGERIFCVAADDNHDSHPLGSPKNDSFGGFTVIKADRLDYESIISALLAGNFYASEGPAINDLWYEDGFVHITVPEASKITYTTGTRRSRVAFPESGETMTEAAFEVSDYDNYFRLTVFGKDGKMAFTNAYFLDSIR